MQLVIAGEVAHAAVEGLPCVGDSGRVGQADLVVELRAFAALELIAAVNVNTATRPGGGRWLGHGRGIGRRGVARVVLVRVVVANRDDRFLAEEDIPDRGARIVLPVERFMLVWVVQIVATARVLR